MATTKKTTAKKDATKKAVTPVNEKSIFELIAEESKSTEVLVETTAGQVPVRSRIGFGDMVTLINMIVDMCVDEETGEIKWEMFDYISKMAICVSYCGLRVPKSIEIGYMSVCGANGLYEQIKEYIDNEQLNNVIDSSLDKLRAREELNNSVALGKLRELLKGVDELMNMISDASEGYSSEDAVNAMTRLVALTGGK